MSSKPLPCPICASEMVETDDHHGSWWEHRTAGGCILDHIQLLDDHDIHCWNRRALERPLRDAISNALQAYAETHDSDEARARLMAAHLHEVAQ